MAFFRSAEFSSYHSSGLAKGLRCSRLAYLTQTLFLRSIELVSHAFNKFVAAQVHLIFQIPPDRRQPYPCSDKINVLFYSAFPLFTKTRKHPIGFKRGISQSSRYSCSTTTYASLSPCPPEWALELRTGKVPEGIHPFGQGSPCSAPETHDPPGRVFGCFFAYKYR